MNRIGFIVTTFLVVLVADELHVLLAGRSAAVWRCLRLGQIKEAITEPGLNCLLPLCECFLH